MSSLARLAARCALSPLALLAAGCAAPAALPPPLRPEAAGRAAPAGGRDDVLRLRAAYALRGFLGSTKVREFDSRPKRLDLQDDLGLGVDHGLHAELLYDAAWIHVLAELDATYFSGSGTVGEDFQYDEGDFRGGRPFDVDGNLVFARAGAALKLLRGAGEAFWAGPFAGLEYANLTLGITQPGVDQTSESYRQFVPYPIAGLAGGWRIAPRLSLDARIWGTWVENWPTPFAEGGRVYMTARAASAEAILAWEVTDFLELDAGFQFQHWDAELRSREDGNEFSSDALGLILGVGFRF